jgi:endonuclease/exonuclease/phosphatase (EEP) superfamily protein YafD
MALLSRYPILEQGASLDPNILWARVRLDDGTPVLVVNAHPHASDIRAVRVWRGLPLVYGYDPTERDKQIAEVRTFIEPFLRNHEPLVLLGDFNITEWEPAYGDLTTGLQDAHRAVGWGTGNSWRRRANWRFGMLRIDYLLNNERVTPVHISTDCTPRGSDHCIVTGVFDVGEAAP